MPSACHIIFCRGNLATVVFLRRMQGDEFTKFVPFNRRGERQNAIDTLGRIRRYLCEMGKAVQQLLADRSGEVNESFIN